MSIEIKMPTLSPTMTKGVIVAWQVKVGDVVAVGDVIAEVETDKVTVEIEAELAGVISQICVPAGSEALVDSVIAVMANEGEQVAPAKVAEPVEAVAAVKVVEAAQVVKPNVTSDVALSPLAQRMAQQANLDVTTIKGSGAKGRIMKRDIEQALGIDAPAPSIISRSTPAVTPINFDHLPAYTRVKNSGMRTVIAERLTAASRDVPHFNLTIDCRLDALLALRQQLNARNGAQTKISINDMVVKSMASALQKVPAANCMWADDSILYFDQVDISIAVAVKDGLITPVLRNVNGMGLEKIATTVKTLASAAQQGKLKPADYQGGTFTISNLGMFAIPSFTSIINSPQNGILSVGVAEQRPVVDNGQLAVATVMTVTLAMDHRCVDGALGAQLIQAFKGFIEDPITLLL